MASGSEAEGWEGACPRKEGVQCEETEAAIEQPIAASAWKLYGTRPSLENLCVLRAVPRCAPLGADLAAGVGHCARAGAPWVGFSGLELPRDHALGDMPSPIV